MTPAYDPTHALRRRAYRAERRADGLGQQLDRAVRLLGIACQFAAGSQWSTLLTAVEEIDADEQMISRLVALLRETEPGRTA